MSFDVDAIRLYIDWDSDGYSAADLVDDAFSVSATLGLASADSRVADIGVLTIEVSNDGGKYSSENTSSPLYGKLKPNIDMKLEVDADSTTYTLFTGVVKSFLPNSNRYGERTARIECVDKMDDFQRELSLNLPVVENITADTMIKMVASAVYSTAQASATVTITSSVEEGDEVVIGETTYKFTSTLAAGFDVLIGSTSTESAENLTRAINGDPEGYGTSYHAGTTPNTFVSAESTLGVVSVKAIMRGTFGNSISIESRRYHWHATSDSVVVGSVLTGSVSDTNIENGTVYQIAEVASTPGLDVQFLVPFELGGKITNIQVIGRYASGTGKLNVDIWDYHPVSPGWVTVGAIDFNFSTNETHNVQAPKGLTFVPTVTPTAKIRFSLLTLGATARSLVIDHFGINGTHSGTSWQSSPGLTVSSDTLTGGVDGPSSFDYDSGSQTFEYAGDTWSTGVFNAMSVIEQIVKSERGLFAINQSGEPVFRNTQYEFLAQTQTPIVTDNSHSSIEGVRTSFDDICNAVVVTQPVHRELSSGVVASGPRSIEIPPGVGTARWNPSDGRGTPGTVSVKLPFKEPTSGTPIGAVSITPILHTTNYEVNSERDGSGVNLSSREFIRISYAIVGSEIEISFWNYAQNVLYVLDLQVTGTGLGSFDVSQEYAQDDTSIAAYGRINRSYDLPLETQGAFAEALASFIVGENKDPRQLYDSVSFDTPSEACTTQHLLGVELFDLITLSDDQVSISEDKVLVLGMSFSLDSTSISNINFNIMKLSDHPYLTLDDAVLGMIDDANGLAL